MTLTSLILLLEAAFGRKTFYLDLSRMRETAAPTPVPPSERSGDCSGLQGITGTIAYLCSVSSECMQSAIL